MISADEDPKHAYLLDALREAELELRDLDARCQFRGYSRTESTERKSLLKEIAGYKLELYGPETEEEDNDE